MKKHYRVLSKDNDIGFDFDTLPPAPEDGYTYDEYIFQNKDKIWRYERVRRQHGDMHFMPYYLNKYWFFPAGGSTVRLSNPPSDFTEDWINSLFKIERDESNSSSK